MKRILTSISICLLFILPLSSKSQTINVDKFPTWYVVGSDTVGIIISMSQACDVSKKLQLYSLLKNLRAENDTLNDRYVLLLNEYENTQKLFKIKVSSLEDLDKYNKQIIEKLNDQINNYSNKSEICNKSLEYSNEIVKYKEREIRRYKKITIILIASYFILTYLFISSK